MGIKLSPVCISEVAGLSLGDSGYRDVEDGKDRYVVSVGSAKSRVSGAADEEVGRVAGTPYVVGSGPVTCEIGRASCRERV